jgi:Xaa-Pro aminopeptidase
LKNTYSNTLQSFARKFALIIFAMAMFGSVPALAQYRTREPNSEYASRRARLRAKVDAPIVVFGYTGKESASEAYVLNQETNFYYLTGHNEEGAALLLVPDGAAAKGWSGPSEIFYLPPHNRLSERWNGPRLGPADPGIQDKTGFAEARNSGRIVADLTQLAQNYKTVYTLVAAPNADAGFPHLQNWKAWIEKTDPGVTIEPINREIAALREVKSQTELALMQKAIDASIDAHLAAMRMARPGIWEYQIAARMQEIHFAAGCETEAYSPIVGAGFNSTVLHYDKVGNQLQDGDIVVLDVAGQYSGYTADITRTLPANGKFTPRQREIYDVVYDAQQAVFAALKPGAHMRDLQRIATDYINSHGKDSHGDSLGKYFIHGIGHHLGLDVHDANDPSLPLAAGMVITVEPGIYIPDEKLGVRIEDDVLITDKGYTILTQRLPRAASEVEKIMADAKKDRAKTEHGKSAGVKSDGGNSSGGKSSGTT